MLFWHKSKCSSLNIGLTPWRRAAVFSHPATVCKDKYKKIRGYSIGVCILAATDRNTYICSVCIFWFSVHILALIQASWTTPLLYIFSVFYLFILIFLSNTVNEDVSRLDLWEMCLLCVSGLWPVEEEEFSDIMSRHAYKSRFPFKKGKIALCAGVGRFERNWNPTLAFLLHSCSY